MGTHVLSSIPSTCSRPSRSLPFHANLEQEEGHQPAERHHPACYSAHQTAGWQDLSPARLDLQYVLVTSLGGTSITVIHNAQNVMTVAVSCI